MATFLSDELKASLDEAHKADMRRKARLSVVAGERAYPVLRIDASHFVVSAQDAPRLRGFVDIYDGARHTYTALIVASNQFGDEVEFEFKRQSIVSDRAPLDFERDEAAPIALLGST